MSSYSEFLAERDKIDFLVQQGYKIKQVHENLSGAFVEFHLSSTNVSEKSNTKETLHILTADARKYFSALLIKQQNE